ncbi:MAG: alanine racemase, partial [Vicinamibacteria bacterium]
VKANAYGHGARIVAPLIRNHVDWFGVNSLEEAEELADAGIERPILIMGHTEPADADRVVSRGFRQVLFRRDVADALSEAAAKLGKPARIHLKVETGLNRLGVPLSEVKDWADRLKDLEGVYTHFADVEDPESKMVPIQRQKLREAAAILEAAGHHGLFLHASPTAGALLHRESGLTITRVGIGLYGIWPSAATRRAAESRGALSPVLSWKSRLAQVKTVPRGGSVGYDVTYQAASDRRIAVVPVGYADGYDRRLSNRGEVLVRGRRAPVVGRVAMNMLMVDVTDADAREDDEVVLLGEQGGESVTADDLAAASGTIAYEVVARLNPQLPRRIVRLEPGEPPDEGDVGGRPLESR